MEKKRRDAFQNLRIGNSGWHHMPVWHGCWAPDSKEEMTGRMGKGNGRILKMKTSSWSSTIEQRLPEEIDIAMVSEMAKVAGYKNITFAETLWKVISHIKLNQEMSLAILLLSMVEFLLTDITSLSLQVYCSEIILRTIYCIIEKNKCMQNSSFAKTQAIDCCCCFFMTFHFFVISVKPEELYFYNMNIQRVSLVFFY